MSINLTDELLAKTKKGKIASAKQVFLEGDQENLQQIGDKTHQLEDSIKDITISGGASTANAVSYNNEASGMTAVTAQGAMDELAAKNKSQDAEIDKKANSADVTSQMQTEQTRVNNELAKKFNSENITQESGDAEDKVMSQKASKRIFRELSNKASSNCFVLVDDYYVDGTTNLPIYHVGDSNYHCLYANLLPNRSYTFEYTKGIATINFYNGTIAVVLVGEE